MPRLVKLQEELGEKLVVIGPHCQNVSKEDVIARCKELKINYTITNNGEVKGKSFSGIPKCFVFDSKGELVYDGRPEGEMDKIVENAVKAAPDWLLGDHAYAKLKSQAAAIASRKGLGKALAELRKLKDDPDAGKAEEAGWLLERLEPYAQGLLAKAKAAETTDPPKALELYTKASALFQGDQVGTDAAEALKRLKADPGFKKEMDAAAALKNVQDACEKFKPCKSTKKLDLAGCEDCRKKNAALMNSLVGQLKAIVQKYEGTGAAKEAEGLLKAWGL